MVIKVHKAEIVSNTTNFFYDVPTRLYFLKVYQINFIDETSHTSKTNPLPPIILS